MPEESQESPKAIPNQASDTAKEIAIAFGELRAVMGNRATDAEIIREHHSHGESYHQPALPDIVCFPRTTEEVSTIVKITKNHKLPIIAFGAGTSLEGQVHAVRGGVTVSLREMSHIVRISAEDLTATVEAGVTTTQLKEALRKTGLTFFIDPGAECTLGGMTATGASGTTAVRYGTMRENVLALTVVLADGQIIRTGTEARKSSAGYDLTRLFVGSEGTLGIITAITLRLHPIPEAIAAATCAFETVGGAVSTVIAVIQLGMPVARIELLDERQIEAINRYSKTNYPVRPTLFFEFHGDSQPHVAEQAETAQALAEERGGSQFGWATSLEERERLWKARHDAYYASLALRPGSKAMITDVCVPISRLSECILATKQDHAHAPFPVTLVGHVGDGNFHMIYIVDPQNASELQAAHRLSDAMVQRALSMGGTCSGEHGIGTGKIDYLCRQFGNSVEIMRTIKRSLDPDNRMNPGKVVAI